MPKALNREDVWCDVYLLGENQERVKLYLHANPGTTRHYDIDKVTFWTDELRAEIGDPETVPGESAKIAKAEHALRDLYRIYNVSDEEWDTLGDYARGLTTGVLTAVRDVAKQLGIDLEN
jgi:hypothetical protein